MYLSSYSSLTVLILSQHFKVNKTLVTLILRRAVFPQYESALYAASCSKVKITSTLYCPQDNGLKVMCLHMGTLKHR